jgi:hypothetical protein
MALPGLLQSCSNKLCSWYSHDITKMLQGWRHKVVITFLFYHDCIGLVWATLNCNKSDNAIKLVISCQQAVWTQLVGRLATRREIFTTQTANFKLYLKVISTCFRPLKLNVFRLKHAEVCHKCQSQSLKKLRMDADSSYRRNFDLDKKNEIHYCSWKEHLKMSKIARFGCELL